MVGTTLLIAGAASAADDIESTSRAAHTSAEQPPSTVEDFSYPGAEKILKEKNLKLKHGNGKILLADCDSEPSLLRFAARDRDNDDFCFKVTGDNGYLSLEVPSVGGVKSSVYNAKINMTVGDEHKSFDIPKNSWKGVGENADPAGREHTLVEIFTSK